jgi:hypothetical protein
MRGYNRAYSLLAVGLLGSFLLLMWGISVLGGTGLGYYSAAHNGLPWTVERVWQYGKAVLLIAIALGVLRVSVEMIEQYNEVTFLHREVARLQGRTVEADTSPS